MGLNFDGAMIGALKFRDLFNLACFWMRQPLFRLLHIPENFQFQYLMAMGVSLNSPISPVKDSGIPVENPISVRIGIDSVQHLI